MSNWNQRGINPVVATPTFIAQNVSSTATALSGISEFVLDSNKLNMMVLTVETNPIRWRDDGSSPTTSVGHILAVGQSLEILGKKRILDFRFIGSGGSAAVVSVSLDDTARAGGVV